MFTINNTIIMEDYVVNAEWDTAMHDAFASDIDEFEGHEPNVERIYGPPVIDKTVKMWSFRGADVYHDKMRRTSSEFRVASQDGHSFVDGVQDFEIAYTTWGRKGAGPNILMLHGVPTNMKQWYPAAERLSRFAYCVPFDMLGMGRSTKPLFDTDMIREWWKWKYDTEYIERFADHVFGKGARFHFFADDWGGGIATDYAAKKVRDARTKEIRQKFGERLLSLVLVDPIAGPGYPVSEIQAIGRASQLPFDDREEVMKGIMPPSSDSLQWAMGAFDQTLVQIYKTMIFDSSRVYNQWVLRIIKETYIETDYERPADHNPAFTGKPPGAATSLSMRLKFVNIKVLADRASILSPGLLLPRHPQKAPEGVPMSNLTMPLSVIWGSGDNMMPANQIHFFAHAANSPHVDIYLVPEAGHFAITDQPDLVSQKMLMFLQDRTVGGEKSLAQVFLGLNVGLWKGNEAKIKKKLENYYKS